jgi:hypothetical protein
VITSEARVSTDRPARYMGQLCKHFGNNVHTEYDEDSGLIQFSFGTCRLAVETDALVLRAEAADDESLTRLEDVAGSHLVRFGQRDELTVSWQRA